MADYLDSQGVNYHRHEAGPSNFVRPLNLVDRKSGGTNASYNSRARKASGLSHVTYGPPPFLEESQQDPAKPIVGTPTPAMQSKPLRPPGDEPADNKEGGDEDLEYMIVDVDQWMVSQLEAQNQPPSGPGFQESPLNLANNKPVLVKVQGGRKGFVGGFVSRLRRLPRLLRNQRDQAVQRQPSHDKVLKLPGFEDSPGYGPLQAHPPAIIRPAQPASNLRHPQSISHTPSVPVSHQVTLMNFSHHTQGECSELSESRISRDPRYFDPDELDHDHNHSGSEGDQHSAHKQSTAAHSTHHLTQYSTDHPSRRSGHHSPSHKSSHHSVHASPHHSTASSSPQTVLSGDTSPIQVGDGEPEAVVMHLLPTSDYKNMIPESPPSSSSSAPANLNRLQRFVTDVYNLPWVGTQVTANFVPEHDGRKYRGMDPDEKKSSKLPQSWYPALHHDLDLLEGESPSQSAPVVAHRRQNGHRPAVTEPTITPTGAGITQSATPNASNSVNPEPTSRHSRPTRDFILSSNRHRRHHRDHSRPRSPPLYPVIASPQPLYLYSGPASPHLMSIPQPARGPSAPSPKSKKGIVSPAVPIYMVPLPAPVYQPISGFHYATPQLTPLQPTSSQRAQSQSAQSQPAANPPTSS